MTIKQFFQTNTDFDIITKEQTSISRESNNLKKESINNSQSSTISTPSKDFNFNVSKKRFPEGNAPGRKAEKKSKIDHSGSQ
jgi:hypothetical protein